ncbi:acyl-CoA carboxylase subunit epsilon [Actinomycetospora cinnamomea]|uniref:Acyl-CoA carboxylase epsilon subunit-like protein n=1 Tax=Actinomycetospora cinnamomea TaxID=663609 RepID=A0A2U1FSB0_9PSEU|nr:acyl-CoA carboxylase subunit epsilon [Actinomycetospora cinnamomea]PVZ14940.1 acyl-CoA carboxylase epsilon subunit-like protein [Actinomycetospora cinnamomea]
MSAANDEESARPVLRIVRGEPDAVEIAALTAVLAAAGGGGDPEGEAVAPVAPSTWARPVDLVRGPVHPGPGGWRASARPR